MRYTELGHTGMSLSSLAFGASSLGSVFHETKEKESIEAVEAAIEGGMSFTMAVASKLREGKRLRDLDGDDWADIAGQSGKGVVRGGVRGAETSARRSFSSGQSCFASMPP